MAASIGTSSRGTVPGTGVVRWSAFSCSWSLKDESTRSAKRRARGEEALVATTLFGRLMSVGLDPNCAGWEYNRDVSTGNRRLQLRDDPVIGSAKARSIQFGRAPARSRISNKTDKACGCTAIDSRRLARCLGEEPMEG